MLNVPSGFLYQPSKAGDTDWPDSRAGPISSCWAIVSFGDAASRTADVTRENGRTGMVSKVAPWLTLVKRRRDPAIVLRAGADRREAIKGRSEQGEPARIRADRSGPARLFSRRRRLGALPARERRESDGVDACVGRRVVRVGISRIVAVRRAGEWRGWVWGGGGGVSAPV